MAKKMAGHFRAVREVQGKKDEEGNPVYQRVHFKPGDDPSELPPEVQDTLEKRGVIVDERRLTANSLVTLPYGHPDREVPVAEPQGQEPPTPQEAGGSGVQGGAAAATNPRNKDKDKDK